MRKVIFTIILLTTVFIFPCIHTNAQTTELDDVPMFYEYLRYGGGSKKAYLYYDFDESSEKYTLTYYNSSSSKLLYRSGNKFSYKASISEDGTTAFFSINNFVYRYSYTDGKIEKIYTIPKEGYTGRSPAVIYSSPDGKYCLIKHGYYPESKDKDMEVHFRLWHDGKIISDEVYGEYDSGRDVSVSNDGKVIHIYTAKLYSFSSDTGKTELFADVPSEKYYYKTDIFHDKGTYIMYGYIKEIRDADNDDPDYDNYKVIYSGRLYEEPKLIYSGNIVPDNIISCNGEAIVFYDGEYIVRIALESGKSKKIIKLSSKLLEEDRLYNHFMCSDDTDSAAYINYSTNKLVRLSGWDPEKNAYTVREEIGLNGTKEELMRYGSDDLSIIEIIDKDPDGSDNEYKHYAAFFDEKKLVHAPGDNIIRIDRFGHVICGDVSGYSDLEILGPDGSRKKVFTDEYSYYFDSSKCGYFMFGVKEATAFGSDGEEFFGIYHDYYINEKGEAVFLWKGRNTYEIFWD